MLVLSRQLDESIMIGDDIVITLVDIRGDKIRLGIAAPPNVPIHRQEVYESIQRENMQAAFVERQLGEPVGGKPSTVRLRVARAEVIR
ncbi:carbon storage regulator CsrA [bacterium]|jgi:carbon storage regulator|nr:carbon storage regulator CsrA [bacterium]